jgi:hypothetical protein
MPNAAFPNLTPTNHRVIGPAGYEYNCIAWACGNVRRWWQPGPLCHWPITSDPDDASIDNLLAALVAVGFSTCPEGAIEAGFEKIAVYATPTEYTHAARLLPTGKWSSKLGQDALIEHDTPEDIAGGIYGAVIQFMKRPFLAE